MRRGTVTRRTRRAMRWPGGRPDRAALTEHAQGRWVERGGYVQTGWDAADAFRRTQFVGAVAGGLGYGVGPWLFLVRPTRRGWRVTTVLDRRVVHPSATGAALVAEGLTGEGEDA